MLLDGQDVTDDPMYVRARKGIGYLPQEPSIFRGLTVEQNILAILETLDLSASERRERARDLLAELNLQTVAGSAAYTLSGGERRRPRTSSSPPTGTGPLAWSWTCTSVA